MSVETSRSTQRDKQVPSKTLSEAHLFKVIQRLYDRESGEVPDPLQIRAAAIVSALGLPSGQYSALGTKKNNERTKTNTEKDRVIAEYLTNKAGVIIQEDPLIVSHDFRDIYPDGLPVELKKVLDPDTLAIMEIEFEHKNYIQEIRSQTDYQMDRPVNYFRLAGGIDLFLRAYGHNKFFHKNHKHYLERINAHAKIICIEGFADDAVGEKLQSFWGGQNARDGNYDALMHEAVDAGFQGYFTEADSRDRSKISMDGELYSVSKSLDLSQGTFNKFYFEFLEREHPTLARKIGTPENLRSILFKQSTRYLEKLPNGLGVFHDKKRHSGHHYLTNNNETSMEPTFLELGQSLFSDALASIKLQMMAKLMIDGHLHQGPIIDYEGSNHLSGKSFFLRYPCYAMEVVLRTINELMAGHADEKGLFSIPDSEKQGGNIYQIFENPDWKEIVEEITRLHFKEVENDASKTTAPGPNQRKLLDYSIDFLKLYRIDPAKIMPSSEEIGRIRQKLLK